MSIHRAARTILPIILPILILGGVFFLTKEGQWSYRFEAPSRTIPPPQHPLALKDTDGDGLKDWEEELWQTNPSNPDTDGDGTTDGEELKNGRNPTMVGPDDTLDPKTVGSKINPQTEADLTETDKLARLLFAKYAATRKSGVALTEKDYAELLTKALKDEPPQIPAFSPRDFVVISDESRRTLKAYGNALGQVVTRHLREASEHELVILDRAIKQDNVEELKKLDVLIAAHRGMLRDLLAVPVPKSALADHLTLANTLSRRSETLAGLRLLFTDPVKALRAVAQYPEAATAVVRAILILKGYFAERGISFGENEDGYTLFGSI